MSKKKTIAFLAGGTALAAGITAHVLRKKAEKTTYKAELIYAYTHKFKYLRYNVISHTFSYLRNNYNLTFAFFAASKSDNVIVKKSSYDISDNIGAMRFALAFMTFSKKFRTSLPFA